MTFKLLEDRVAVIADEVKETNDAGLYIPESGQEILRYGTVAVVGVGRRSDATGEPISIDVKVNDRVFFNRHSGSPIEVEGQEYVFLNPREIVGVVEPAKLKAL